MIRTRSALAAGGLVSALAAPARADDVFVPLYRSSYYELTYGLETSGYGFDGPTFGADVIRLYERSGFLSSLPEAMVLGFAGGVAEAGAQSTSTTTSTYETPTERVTVTTQRTRTPEEIARARAVADAASATRRVPGHAEVAVYFPHGTRRASGAAVTLYPLSLGGRVTADLGAHVVYLHDDTRDFRSIGASWRLGALLYRNYVQVETELRLNLGYWGDGDDR